MRVIGQVDKMQNAVNDTGQVSYWLPLGEQRVPLNTHIGTTIVLRHEAGKITCMGCGSAIKKTYQQGYCFLCTQRLARCDLCIVKPEQCHFHLGTCREPKWAQRFCMQAHYVYLANSSGVKVGITRGSNVPYRWIDQGASEALLIAQCASRRIAGLLEVQLAKHVADKTNWRKMLSGPAESADLAVIRDELFAKTHEEVAAIHRDFNPDDLLLILDEQVYHFDYPVLQYPNKIKSFNFDKTPEITAMLTGIKGQYLIFGDTVLNIRKFSGYEISFESLEGEL